MLTKHFNKQQKATQNKQNQLEEKLDNLMEIQNIKLEEHKKLSLQIRSDINNQAKQQELLQNLVLDMKSTNKVEKAIFADNESNECKICMERQKKVVLVPCGHTMCDVCARKLKKGECPTCRSKISDTQKFYL